MDSTSAHQRVTHSGSGGEFFVIFLVNFLLTVITLGVYSFWAKARTRRYLWSHTSFDNEQFEYDGTGKETFVGFLKALGIMLGLLVVTGIVAWALMMVFAPLGVLVLILAYLFIVFIAPSAARFASQRYLLSRTRYRGVRFALLGSAIRYGFKVFGQTVLTILSLGLYAPFASMKLHQYRTEHTLYGSEPAHFDGAGKDMFGDFFVAWLLTLPTLGLIWFWYGAKVSRYKAQHTRVGALQFTTTFTGGQYFWLVFSNLLLVVFTLGLGLAWAAVRSMHFSASHVLVAGELDYSRVKQAAGKPTATGEGFADAMEVDFGL